MKNDPRTRNPSIHAKKGPSAARVQRMLKKKEEKKKLKR